MTHPTSQHTASAVHAIAAADFNNDGDPDLATTSALAGTTSICINANTPPITTCPGDTDTNNNVNAADPLTALNNFFRTTCDGTPATNRPTPQRS